MPTVYLDTNIYRHIAQNRQAHDVTKIFRSARWHVMASASNLFETYAISDHSLRQTELATITSVAASFEQRPASYREAAEVRRAIQRHRSHWIRHFVYEREAKSLLAAHRQRWLDAKAGNPPSNTAYATYQRVFEDGNASSREQQKQLRTARLDGLTATLNHRFGDRVGIVETDLRDPDTGWRTVSFSMFESALFQNAEQSRDMADWLRPFLKLDRIDPSDFFVLWMRDIELVEVPRSAWIGYVSSFQLGNKINHGNAMDLEHAAMVFDVDVFVTADRAFYSAMCEARDAFPRLRARILLWERSMPSALDALQSVINATGT